MGTIRGLTMVPAFVNVAFRIVSENVTAAGLRASTRATEGIAHRSGLAGQAQKRDLRTFFLPFFFFFLFSLSVLSLSASDEVAD